MGVIIHSKVEGTLGWRDFAVIKMWEGQIDFMRAVWDFCQERHPGESTLTHPGDALKVWFWEINHQGQSVIPDVITVWGLIEQAIVLSFLTLILTHCSLWLDFLAEGYTFFVLGFHLASNSHCIFSQGQRSWQCRQPIMTIPRRITCGSSTV